MNEAIDLINALHNKNNEILKSLEEHQKKIYDLEKVINDIKLEVDKQSLSGCERHLENVEVDKLCLSGCERHIENVEEKENIRKEYERKLNICMLEIPYEYIPIKTPSCAQHLLINYNVMRCIGHIAVTCSRDGTVKGINYHTVYVIEALVGDIEEYVGKWACCYKEDLSEEEIEDSTNEIEKTFYRFSERGNFDDEMEHIMHSIIDNCLMCIMDY